MLDLLQEYILTFNLPVPFEPKEHPISPDGTPGRRTSFGRFDIKLSKCLNDFPNFLVFFFPELSGGGRRRPSTSFMS